MMVNKSPYVVFETFSHRMKKGDVEAIYTVLLKQSKTDFTGKKLICPNPILNVGSTI
jgi:hypothetical protein